MGMNKIKNLILKILDNFINSEKHEKI